MPGQRVGVMGGSFDPPHAGHLIVARTALRRLKLDQLWWLVTPGNPLKAHGGLAPLAQRVAACRALAGGDRRMVVTAFEAQLGSAYTAETLAFLRQRLPQVRFVWVMGADNLATFDRWQNWRGIARSMPIAVVDRPGWRFKAMAGPAAQALAVARVPEARAGSLAMRRPPAWMFLTSKLSSLSSSGLRRGIEG
jgi:nicotinate-nucleotide adenylyltransferase